MSLEMVPGAKCYVPDEEHIWLPAEVISQETGTKKIKTKVFKSDGSTVERIVDLEDKKTRQLMSGKGEVMDTVESLPFQNENVGEQGIEDMITMNYLHEAAILYNVKKRFLCELPYTYTGNICIAVNPYKWLPQLYAEEQHIRYLNLPREELPPHVYATSVASYEDMKFAQRNQSILVSGESGAGKTETTKILMNHLATIAGGMNDGTIKKIIQVSPLLEYFGNAKTVRNDNSSRFGKFTQLQFDKFGTLVGAKCKTYLLEKTRVISHEYPERNYHIFYQLIDSDIGTTHLLLNPSTNYAYIGEKSVAKIEGKTDMEHFQITKDRLTAVGLSEAKQMDLYQTLAGILHLGEIQIIANSENDEESLLMDQDQGAKHVTELMGLSLESVQKALCTRTMRARNDVYSVPLKKELALDCRDALSKAIYSKIFDYLVDLINKSLSKDQNMAYHIGVLDIFGFEHFKHNSFEQFCINYANEKLQQKFTSDVFKTVQIEYEEEGIKWNHIEFADNQDVLNVIEDRIGIISLLNEELRKTKGSEMGFVSTISTINIELYKPSVIEFPRTSRTEFIIKHYAAPVKYEAIGFLEKHKDSLLPDLSELMRSSSMEFVSFLFEEKKSATTVKVEELSTKRRSGGGSLATVTVGTQFKESLTELMNSIQSTKVHYVRCIKPNPVKSSTEMDNAMVVSQLRCAGVIEAIRISRAAYPNRQSHDEFLTKFRLFVPPGGGTPKEKCEQLMDKLKLTSPEQYQMGWTKIYFQLGVLEELEDRRKKFLDKKARYVTNVMKMFAQRMKYLKQLQAIVKLQSVIRCVIAMRRYHTFQHGLVLAQARFRGIQGRIKAVEVKRNHSAVIIQRHLRGYGKRRIYQIKKKTVIQIQSYVRMKLQRPKYLAALKEKKLEADMIYQLKVLQERLLEEQKRSALLQEEKESLKTQTSAVVVNASSSSVGVGSTNMIMADAGGMIGKLQEDNAKHKKENEEMKNQISSLKAEVDKLKSEKEMSSASSHVKLQQYKDKIRDQDKIIAANAIELKKLKDAIQKNGGVALSDDSIAPKTKRMLFRTLGAKKLAVTKPPQDGVLHDSITGSDDLDDNDKQADGQSKDSKTNLFKSSGFKMSKAKFWGSSAQLNSSSATASQPQLDSDGSTASDHGDAKTGNGENKNSLESQPRASVLNSVQTGVSGAMSNLKGRMSIPTTLKSLYHTNAATNPAASAAKEGAKAKAEAMKLRASLPPQESFNLDSLPEAPLPLGWEAKVSRSNGKVYYVNKALKQTQWDRPTIENLKLKKAAKKATPNV